MTRTLPRLAPGLLCPPKRQDRWTQASLLRGFFVPVIRGSRSLGCRFKRSYQFIKTRMFISSLIIFRAPSSATAPGASRPQGGPVASPPAALVARPATGRPVARPQRAAADGPPGNQETRPPRILETRKPGRRETRKPGRQETRWPPGRHGHQVDALADNRPGATRSTARATR